MNRRDALTRLASAAALVSLPRFARAQTPAAVPPGAALSADLHKILGDEPGNVFFSAISLHGALAMLLAGARGETASQIARVLHADGTADAAVADAGALLKTIGAGDAHAALSVADALWLSKGFEVRRDFGKTLARDFGATTGPLDVKAIDKWCADHTNGKITHLFDSVDDMVMALTNAVYFKGRWAQQFDKASTAPRAFHAPKGDRKVPMMSQVGSFARAKDGDVDLLGMPYEGNGLSMGIALPPAGGMAAAERALDGATLGRWSAAVSSGGVPDLQVVMPRFKIESSMALVGALEKLGMRAAFGGGADLSGIAGKPGDLFVNQVLQKSYVKVDEEGTEAAAVTGIGVSITAVRVPPPPFVVDRPFLFWIRHAATGAILFFGRVDEPAE